MKTAILLSLFVTFLSGPVRAERIGVVVYDSLGSNDPRTILGHAAAYLPHVCTGENNFQFRVCNSDEQGVVLNRSEGVTTTLRLDSIAVPLSVNLYGMKDVKQPPLLLTHPLAVKMACDYYHQAGLGQFLNPDNAELSTDKLLDPNQEVQGCENIPGGNWASIAKTSFDSSTIISVDLGEIIAKRVATEKNLGINDPSVLAESKVREDAAWERLIQYLNLHALDLQKYKALKANCAHWVQEVIKVALDDFKDGGKLEDFYVESPLAVASGLKEIAKHYRVPYQVGRIAEVASDVPRSFLPSNPIYALTSPRSILTLPVQAITLGIASPMLAIAALRQYVPGFRIPFFVRPKFQMTKEVKSHADSLIANASASMNYEDLDAAEKTDQKTFIKARQNTLFGTSQCWMDAKAGVQAVADWALEHQFISDDEYAQMRKSKWGSKTASRIIPYDPYQPGRQSIELVKSFTDHAIYEMSHDDQLGLMIVMTTPDGKKVGLSPGNADLYDLNLGLKALLISVYFDLDQDPINRPAALDFDAKLKALESVIGKLGGDANQFPISSGVAYCSSMSSD